MLIVALASGLASATEYIASVDGTSAGVGTLTSPYNITTAISKAVAGDIVYLRGGQYLMSAKLSLSKGGTSSAYINIWAYPGDARPILDFYNVGYSGTNSANERGIQISGSYYYIKGIDITRAGDNGMNVSSSHNIIQNCRFYKNCDAGLQITGSSTSEGYNQVIDCDSYLNFDFKSVNSNGTSNAGGNADGFACKLTVGPGNKFIRCRSWANSDDAYDCFGSINDIYFKDCWAIANGQASYDISDYPGAGTLVTVTNQGNGNGFKVGGNGAVGGAILIGCISTGHKIASSSNKGFDQNNNVGRVYCFNCLSYNDGRGFSFPNNTDSRGEHQFCNNIVLSANNSNSIKSTSVQKTNTWNSITVSASDFVSLAVENAKTDRSADGSLPDMGGLFHLKSTSGLINQGTVVAIDTIALPYSGSAPDLGPYEYKQESTDVASVQTDCGATVAYSTVNHEISITGSISDVEVFQLSGQKIYNQRISTENLNIPADNWFKGICLVRVVTQSGIPLTKKIMIN